MTIGNAQAPWWSNPHGWTGCSGHGDVVDQVKAMKIEAAVSRLWPTQPAQNQGWWLPFGSLWWVHVPQGVCHLLETPFGGPHGLSCKVSPLPSAGGVLHSSPWMGLDGGGWRDEAFLLQPGPRDLAHHLILGVLAAGVVVVHAAASG